MNESCTRLTPLFGRSTVICIGFRDASPLRNNRALYTNASFRSQACRCIVLCAVNHHETSVVAAQVLGDDEGGQTELPCALKHYRAMFSFLPTTQKPNIKILH